MATFRAPFASMKDGRVSVRLRANERTAIRGLAAEYDGDRPQRGRGPPVEREGRVDEEDHREDVDADDCAMCLV